MNKRSLIPAACLLALFAAGCSKASVAAGADKADAAFGQKVRAYLLEHPEVIQEAVQKLQDNRDQAAQAKAASVLKSRRGELERDPADFVANPNGKVTVTEFYDYRCPHCINVAPQVASLIKSNPDVRFVFKEMPIFGATSEHAARLALAVKAKGGDYVGVYNTLMAAKGGMSDASLTGLANTYGVTAETETDAAKSAAAAHFSKVRALAEELGIDGTPTFVIGDTLVPGEDVDAVKAAIAEQRKAT